MTATSRLDWIVKKQNTLNTRPAVVGKTAPSSLPAATGGCLCGAVRYEVHGPLRDVVICHCSRCRRTHGHAAAYSACAHADLVFAAAGGLRWYEEEGRSRGFCRKCGASLFWRAAGRETTSISAGTLDAPTGLRTIAQIHTADAGDYYEVAGEGARHAAELPAE